MFQANTNTSLKNMETQVRQLTLAMQNQPKDALKNFVGIVYGLEYLFSSLSHGIITSITHNFKIIFQSGVNMMGAVTKLDLIFSNADLHDSSKLNFASFSSSLHNGLEIFEKSFMNLL